MTNVLVTGSVRLPGARAWPGSCWRAGSMPVARPRKQPVSRVTLAGPCRRRPPDLAGDERVTVHARLTSASCSAPAAAGQGRAGRGGRHLPSRGGGQRGMRSGLRPGHPGEPARHRGAARVVPRACGTNPVVVFASSLAGLRDVRRAPAPGGRGRSDPAESAVQLRRAEGHRRAAAGRLHPQGIPARARGPADDGQRAAGPAERGGVGLPVRPSSASRSSSQRATCPVGAADRGGARLAGPGHRAGCCCAATSSDQAWGGRTAVNLRRPHRDGRGHGRRAGAGRRTRGERADRLGARPGRGRDRDELASPVPRRPGGRLGLDAGPGLRLRHPDAPRRDQVQAAVHAGRPRGGRSRPACWAPCGAGQRAAPGAAGSRPSTGCTGRGGRQSPGRATFGLVGQPREERRPGPGAVEMVAGAGGAGGPEGQPADASSRSARPA